MKTHHAKIKTIYTRMTIDDSNKNRSRILFIIRHKHTFCFYMMELFVVYYTRIGTRAKINLLSKNSILVEFTSASLHAIAHFYCMNIKCNKFIILRKCCATFMVTRLQLLLLIFVFILFICRIARLPSSFYSIRFS